MEMTDLQREIECAIEEWKRSGKLPNGELWQPPNYGEINDESS